MTSDFQDVGKFHQKFSLPYLSEVQDAGPRQIESDHVDFRIGFLHEELTEFEEAVDAGNHAKMFDSLIDLNYISLGTAHLLGYPWEIGWAMVHQANMSKVRSSSKKRSADRGSSFDVVKPPGWVAPDISRLLKSFGWGS